MNGPGAATSAATITVVLPTRNRADLAERAVHAWARAAVPGVTLIVSDNSTDTAEVERLRAAVDRLDRAVTGPVHLVRPDADLPMSEHWEWARRRAAELTDSSHTMFVTDRTLLKPRSLARLGAIARAEPDLVISFNSDLVDDTQQPVVLRQEPWCGATLRVPASRLAELSARLVLVQALPRMLNVLAPRSVMQQLEDVYGDVFSSVAPDFCFCFRYLATGADVIYVDETLTVMHGLRRSNGASTARGVLSQDAEDFQRTSSRSGGHGALLLPDVVTNYNIIAHEYQTVRENAVPGVLPPLDRATYLRTLARETMAAQDGPLKEANATVLHKHGIATRGLRGRAHAAGNVRHLLRTLGPRDFALQARLRIDGALVTRFDDPEAALQHALDQPAPRRTSSSHLRYLAATHLRLPAS